MEDTNTNPEAGAPEATPMDQGAPATEENTTPAEGTTPTEEAAA